MGLRETISTGALCASVLLGGGAMAQDGGGLFGGTGASVTFGPYVRAELGRIMPDADGAYWLPPGAADPQVNFNASAEDVGFGGLAFGYDWQNGIRGELAVFGTGTSDVGAPCSSVSDGTPCSAHASNVDTTLRTRGVMANVFYSPLEARGSNSVFQPFVVAGLGVARNEVGEWTRTNPTSTRPTRSFEGNSNTDLAWSLGVGASWQVTKPGKWPVILEASWRYYDYGTASGGSTPLPGNGASQPRQAFSFDNTAQVVSFGVRVPLQRY